MKKVGAPSAECVLCEFVVKEIDELIAQNKTEVQKSIDIKKLPSFIWQCLVQRVPGKSYVYACRPQINQLFVLSLFATSALSDISLFKHFLFTTQNEIIKGLEEFCSVLPETISNQCKSFVDTYAKAAIIIIKETLTPEEVCTQLGLCKSTNIKSPAKKTNHFVAGELQALLCAIEIYNTNFVKRLVLPVKHLVLSCQVLGTSFADAWQSLCK